MGIIGSIAKARATQYIAVECRFLELKTRLEIDVVGLSVTRPSRGRRLVAPELLLFGSLELRVAGKSVELPTRKLLGLLAYLALEGSASRAELAALLWEADDDRARGNLRGELYRLRDTAFATALEESSGRLRLANGVSTDLAQYERFLARGEWSQAIELRRGVLLEGFMVLDAPNFEEWLLFSRERWQERHAQTLAAYAASLLGLQDWARACEVFEHLLELDPWREEAVRGVMRALSQAGESSRALERFERFSATLRANLEIDPAPETLALAAELRQARASVKNTKLTQSSGVLVGRQDAWTQLEAAWNAGKLVFVFGEPGVGKTRLALEFAASKGAFALLECRAADAAMPYAMFTRRLQEALPQVNFLEIPLWIRSELARLVPEYAPEEHSNNHDGQLEGKSRLLKAVTQFLLRLMQASSSLVFDNAQFFDPASFELALALATRAGQLQPAIRSILTFRHGELLPGVQARVDEYLRSGEAVLIQLEALELEGVQQMLEQDLNLNLDAKRLHRVTGGNPLFVLETLREWKASGQLESEATMPRSTIQTLLQSRLERLDKAARDLVRVAALAGSSFNLLLAAQVLNTDALALIEVTEQLERDGIMQAGRFGHDLMLEAVIAGIPVATRSLLHARLLEALEAVPLERGQAARRLAHARAAGNVTRALYWAERAGFEALEQFGFVEAKTFFDEALDRLSKLESNVNLEVKLRLGLEQALYQLGERETQTLELTRVAALRFDDAALRDELRFRQGRLAESLAQFQEAAQHFTASTTQKAKIRLVYVLEKLGSLDDAIRTAQAVFERPDSPEEAFQAAVLLAELAFEHWDTTNADLWLTRADALVMDNLGRRLRYLRTKMRRAYHAGTLEDALEQAILGEKLALELGALADALNFTNNRALVFMRLQKFTQAIAAFQQVRRAAEKQHLPVYYLSASSNLRLVYARIGAFEQAMMLLPELEQYATRYKLAIDRASSDLISGLTHAYAGDGAKALACFEEVQQSLTPGAAAFQYQASIWHGLALACSLTENFATAEQHARAELEITRQYTDADWVLGQTVLAFAVARQGRLEEALELSNEALEALPEDDRFELPTEPVPWINAQLHHALGHEDQARVALERAHSILERTASALPETQRVQYLQAFRFNRNIQSAINGQWSDVLTML